MNKYIEQEVAIKALMNDAPEKVEYSREDADSTSTERRMIMRLIDADEAIINFGFEWDDVLPTIEEFVRFLKKQSIIDAVPVTRCRECKYHEDTHVTGFEHCCLYDLTMRYNDFCSYGKREGGSDND